MSDRRAEVIDFGKYHGSLEFPVNATVRHFTITYLSQLTISAQAESLRSSLHELEGLMKEYTPLMSKSVERDFGKGVQLGTVFAEVSSALKKPTGR